MSRHYSSNAAGTTLSAGINDSTTSISVAATTGFPAVDFILALDYGAAEQELVLVTNVSGTTLTVTRGYDSTTAQSHSLGASVKHVHGAVDFRDSRTHEAASTGVHGVSGSVVGTTDTQALTNKDLSSGTNTFPASFATASSTTTFSNKSISLGSNTVTGTKAQFNTALTDGDFATQAGTETLTNKTIDLASNTVTTTRAQLNSAVSDADVATLDGTETLTNKTITGLGASSDLSGDFIGGVRYIQKASDESVTSSTTFQDDDTFTFSVAANATYVILFTGQWTENQGGEKAQWSLPAGATFYPDGGAASTSGAWFDQVTGGGGLVKDGVALRIVTSATAGTATLQWAQNVSKSNATTLKAGAFAEIRRVA